ncbi:MAG: hemin ABC transporter ATPase [Acidobacteria bacterium OLB17]|nr:MAG: hemin ABC transporter ATPase [Acidobacteria bacterium OLB17]MCZ2389898.1 ABC transporter ATP-binding protein [Acidobacteriota bacterium]
MLEARNISVKYGDAAVLADASLLLSAGRITAIVGANGAGKTTLIKALNGSVPIGAGEILLDGHSLSTLSRAAIARKVAVVAQETESRFPVTVREFVLTGRFAYGSSFGWESPDDLEAAERALEDCRLENFAGRLMNSLSGGERQRVVLARALAGEGRVLLLDEPTANLDLAHQTLMFRLVRERCEQRDYSAAIITHDLNLAAEFADEVVMLAAGKIVYKGTPQEVLTRDNIREIFNVEVMLDTNPSSGKARVTQLY